MAQDVNKIGGEVRSLQDNTEQLSSELMNDPEKAAQHLDDLQKKCLKYTNDLMNDLLALDSVVGTQEVMIWCIRTRKFSHVEDTPQA